MVFAVAVLPAAVSTGLLSAGRLTTPVVAAAVPAGVLSAGRLITAVELAAGRADTGTVYGIDVGPVVVKVIVHGQFVIVRVVAAVTVYVEEPSVKVVADGQYVV